MMHDRSDHRLCGRLVDIRCLVPGAKFHLAHLIKDSHQVSDLGTMVSLSEWTRADLMWWVSTLQACSRRTWLSNPDQKSDIKSVKAFTDAAGGSVERLGCAIGMLIPPSTYRYLPYGNKINRGDKAYDGKSQICKLSV